jgi:serine palmitoyltransferase
MEGITFFASQTTSVIIGLAVLILLWLLFAPQYKVKKEKEISDVEKEERLAAWRPKPIIPTAFNPKTHLIPEPLVIKSDTGAIIIAEDDKEYLNFASGNYLGLASVQEIKDAANQTIKSYGVGSCGPRGFYGTIDLHLILENTFANFMGAESAILYSDGMACVSSVIPAFCKTGDYIIADKEVNCGIQQGLKLSRSKVSKFEHNDMASLEARLKQNDETMAPHDKIKYRRFIVVEGIYSKTGSMCPLDQVVKLAKKYKFRVLLDDSNAVGVLGKTGRGSLEHWGLKIEQDVELVCVNLDQAISSVGGLCIGAKHAISHQRLSGSGYCFSAASPPYTARAGTYAIGLIETNPELVDQIHKTTAFGYSTFVTKLQGTGLDVYGNPQSPIVVLRPSTSYFNKWLATPDAKKTASLQTHAPIPYAGHKIPGTDIEIYMKLKQIALKLRNEYNIIVSIQHQAPQEDSYPYGLKIQLTTLHSYDDIKLCADLLAKITTEILNDALAEQQKAHDQCELSLA